MFLLQTETDEVLAGLQDGVKLEFKEQTELNGDAPTKDRQGRAGFFTQLSALTKREALGVWRNKPGLIASVMIPLLLNSLYAFIFWRCGDITNKGHDSMSHFGGFTQVAIGGMFGAAQPLLLRFPLDRGIFLREYATQSYGAVAYFLSKTMVELPQS